MPDETYPNPAHGWTCFFCGETFKKPGAAADHFGSWPGGTAACRIKGEEEMGLVMALRKAEALLGRYQNEDTEIHRSLAAIQTDHAAALRREEEAGYARGLADGRAMPDER